MYAFAIHDSKVMLNEKVQSYRGREIRARYRPYSFERNKI